MISCTRTRKRAMALSALATLAGCSQQSMQTRPGLPANSLYVAMGSSFASGPGVTVSADIPANRCARSQDNYAHQLARKRGLTLIDVTCSGAKTSHILGPWNELPPQIEAVKPETRLVTITIGGNDVGYVGGVLAGSCAAAGGPPAGSPFKSCPPIPTATDQDWDTLAKSMRQIVQDVRTRAPQARIIFVEYVRMLPEKGSCPQADPGAEATRRAKAAGQALSRVTREAARLEKVEVLPVDTLSKGRDACSPFPWITGYPRAGEASFVPYHPNLEGMTAIAQLLDLMLGGSKTRR